MKHTPLFAFVLIIGSLFFATPALAHHEDYRYQWDNGGQKQHSFRHPSRTWCDHKDWNTYDYQPMYRRQAYEFNNEYPYDYSQPYWQERVYYPQSFTVRIRNSMFQPQTLTVHRGAMVTWRNDDDRPHAIKAENADIYSAILNTRGEYSFTFEKTGVFYYYDQLLPGVHGTIRVID